MCVGGGNDDARGLYARSPFPQPTTPGTSSYCMMGEICLVFQTMVFKLGVIISDEF